MSDTNYTEITMNGFQIQIFPGYDGDLFFVTKGEFNYSAKTDRGRGMEMATFIIEGQTPKAKLTKEEKIQRCNLVLMSAHIQEVEVKFIANLNGSRYYQARTWAGRHQYQIRFWDDEGERRGTCNCVAKTGCRHLAKAAELDSELNEIPLHLEIFSNYKAHGRKAA